MSKTQSRKGYAVGALVALVSSMVTFAPAQADSTAPTTLLPTSGSTFNTIIGSPIDLVANLDPASVATGAAGTRSPETLYYIISNPDAATISITFGAAPDPADGKVFDYLTYDATTGYATSNTSAITGTTFTSTSADSTFAITTTEEKIAVWGGKQADSTSAFAYNSIGLDTTGTVTAELTVQALWDYDKTGNGDLGIYNSTKFDMVSDVEDVVIYAPGEVSAVTTIKSLTPGTTTASIQVVYGNSVNPFFVNSATNVALNNGGTAVTWASSATWSGVVVGATSTTAGIGYTANTLTAGVNTSGASSPALGVNAAAGIYSAQAYYNGVTMGAASAVWNASAGANSLVSNASLEFVNTLDAAFSSSTARSLSEILVRTGTSTVELTAQLMSSSTVALAASNIEVKAVVAGTLAAGSTVTVTGANGTLVKDGSALTAYARTDADGEATFTITATGAKADALSVTLEAKKSDGTWGPLTQANSDADIDVVWQDAVFTSLTAKPATYVSGANPTVTLKVADQWGKGMSTIGGKTLTAYAVAAFGGVVAPATYSATTTVVDGEASFTFANFAPAGGLAQLEIELFTGGVASSAQVGSTQVVNVYNTAATSEIAIADSFAANVSYVDYVTGDTTTTAVATAVAAAGLSTSEGVAITGNVTNAVGVGQPGVAVSVAAEGILFYADGVYSLGAASTNANEYGAFSVTAIAHTVHAKGLTVSVVADGQTATTLLVTNLPDSIADENLSFTWALPANVVKNTTYAVTATLADKWGNPISTTNASTNAVSFQGVGSVEINSSASAINRNFDKNGQATVFLRSVKDIAGPGSVTATLASTFNYALAEAAPGTSSTIASFNATDAKATAWDESAWSNALTSEIEVLDAAPAAAQKVNAGSFKGYVALYALGYEGQRLSAKVGNDWVIVPSIPAATNDLFRQVEFVGAGVEIAVRMYIDRVLVDTINLVTK